ncbi:hypothetical protein HJC23_013380 [Cyclotella cryptica]|uniref:Uncharacterized protein n=1 Tax=Cyclotella cryptica TaxID=29204 RepID=A0ABD3PXN8_9STRA|eukprot:CCRYP_010949-RA/>CCRYP_010949-RA protein AED:0.02 eAED:0.02 QI:270/1/1/1/1/1/2/1211/534
MFSLATGIYQSYFAPPKISILIVGLDTSGKTALLERVKVTNFSSRLHHASSHNDKCVLGAVAGANMDDDTFKRGARPARLPPPLPPKKATESRHRVDQVLAEEDEQTKSIHDRPQTNNERDDLLQGIPPPPLCGLDNSQGTNGTPGGPADTTQSTINTTQSKTRDSQRPPLPPQPGLSKPRDQAPAPITSTPSKRSSFIQLLRCPSPQRYSSSALGEEEEEYYSDAIHASAVAAIATSAQKQPQQDQQQQEVEEWNTDYLNDYYINYQDGEEFDVKVSNGKKSKMFPLERIRPTLGQNLAKVEIGGCKCSLFDLSGAEKMRPLWERYYRDTDAVIFVVDSSDHSFSNLQQSRHEFRKLCQNEVMKRRIERGLPIMIFANKLDVAYGEYDKGVERANEADRRRQVSWNADEEDAFVGGKQQERSHKNGENEEDCVSSRAIDFSDLLRFFDIASFQLMDGNGPEMGAGTAVESVQYNGNGESNNHHYNHNFNRRSVCAKGNVFLFGGSAKTGEGVKAAFEYLVAQSKKYHLAMHSQ